MGDAGSNDLAIGIVEHKDALRVIEQIIIENNPYCMITSAAAQTYVRLRRKCINDALPVLELLEFGGLSTVRGCLNPLGYDRMLPHNEQIELLINKAWDLHKHKDRLGYERGYCDPRYGLAAGCAGWDSLLTKDFLNHCLITGDVPLKYVSQHAINGKYCKLR
ncbi:hypothetical protein [Dyadobacter sp. CY326]|uniref:hypothetical protein n=1 Tax=Dyadobacter sp. CY326 TaxID=2907300 RepID=UPI001F481F5C|nr:hypothetical protein [Dyadobacter sp. CY326]MCE7065296.1 hypothetical protein [Dyadobacter sp. CY326]